MAYSRPLGIDIGPSPNSAFSKRDRDFDVEEEEEMPAYKRTTVATSVSSPIAATLRAIFEKNLQIDPHSQRSHTPEPEMDQLWQFIQESETTLSTALVQETPTDHSMKIANATLPHKVTSNKDIFATGSTFFDVVHSLSNIVLLTCTCYSFVNTPKSVSAKDSSIDSLVAGSATLHNCQIRNMTIGSTVSASTQLRSCTVFQNIFSDGHQPLILENTHVCGEVSALHPVVTNSIIEQTLRCSSPFLKLQNCSVNTVILNNASPTTLLLVNSQVKKIIFLGNDGHVELQGHSSYETIEKRG